jgi:hypothetical protein
MARHRRRTHRRRRRFGDPVLSMPTFGDIKEYNPFGKTVNATDVAVGSFIGLAGGGLVNYGLRKVWPTAPIPMQYVGAVTAIGAGAAAYTLFRKKSRGRAQGYLAGAVIAGVVPLVWGMVKGALPASVSTYFGDPVLSMPSYRGLLVNSPVAPRLGGLLVNAPAAAMATAPSAARRAMRF